MSDRIEGKNQYFYCSKSNQIRPLRIAMDLQHHALLDHASMFSCPSEDNEGAVDFISDKASDSEQDEVSSISDKIYADVVESGGNQSECSSGKVVSESVGSCPSDSVSNLGTKRKAVELAESPLQNIKKLPVKNINTKPLPMVNHLGTMFTKWDDHEVKALIKAYEQTISKPYTKRELWVKVVGKLIESLGFKGRIDTEMCSRKWNTLVRAYQTAKARNCPSYTEWYYDMKRVIENPLRVLNKRASKQTSKSVLRKLQEEIIGCGSAEAEFLDDELVRIEVPQTSRAFTNKTNKKWSYFEVKALIASFFNHCNKGSEKILFETIATDLRKYNYDVNASMAKRKWKLLIKSYEAAKYKRERGLVSHFEFYDDLAEIFENCQQSVDSNESENNEHSVASVGVTCAKTKKRNEINSPGFSWSSDATKDLINSYRCHMMNKEDNTGPSWQEIARELRSQNHPVTRVMVRNKWQRLKTTYLKYLETDHPQDFEYFDDMTAAVGNEITYLEESSLPEEEEVEEASPMLEESCRLEDDENHEEISQTNFNAKKPFSKKLSLEDEKLRIEEIEYNLMLKYLDLKENECLSQAKQIIIVKSPETGGDGGRIIQARLLFDSSLQET